MNQYSSSGGMNPIGLATPHGAEIHAATCDCSVCLAHRELEEIIAEAERLTWILNPWFVLRKLNGPELDDITEEVKS